MSREEQIKNFFRLANLLGASQAIQGAQQLGIFDMLAGPPKTLAELEEECEFPLDRLELLLGVLVTTGALEKYGDDYALSTAMRLINDHPDVLYGPHWAELTDFLNDTQAEREHEDRHHAFRADGMSLQWTLTAAAMELADHLKIGQERAGLQILDLGAGAAMWSLAMAYRDVMSTITVVDHPDALEAAKKTADEVGLTQRMEFLPGDYRVMELPKNTYDLVLAVDLLQLQPLEKCRIWLEQVFQSLHSGGEAVLIGRFPGNPLGDLQRTLHSLELPLRVPEAQLHEAEEIAKMLRSLGFVVEPLLMLEAPPHCIGAMIAQRK